MAGLYFKVGSDYENVIRLRTEVEKLKSTLSGMDGNTPPATLRAMEVQLAKNTKELDIMVLAAAKAGNELEQNFKKKIFDGSMAVNDFTEEIIKQKAIIRETQEDVRSLSERYAKLGKNNPASVSTLAELNRAKTALQEQKYALGELQTQQANARLSVKKLKDEYALFNKESASTVDVSRQIEAAMGNMAKKVFSAAAAKEFVSQVIEVRAEMQMLNKSFEILLGSKDKADLYVKEIKDYALLSPLSVSDVSKAAQTLLGFNVEANKTIPIIKSIGDISMGDSLKFSSLTLAFAQMSAAGRLMGQDLNQMINAGFNPLQTISDKTGKSISQLKKDMEAGAVSSQMVADAFATATAEGGKFHGMIEKSADGIRNAQNQLTGAIEETLNAIGESQDGIIMGSYEVATSLVQNYDKVGRVIVGLIATYGVYRAAVMLATAAESGHSVAMLLTREKILLVRRAQQLLNATMLSNPYVAVTTLVVGLVAAMWSLSESTTAAEKAQKKFSDRMQEITDDNKNRKEQVDKLITVIRDETATETDRYEAIQKLRDIVPYATKDMSDEAIKTGELTIQKKKYNEELSKQIGLEKQRELNQLYAQKKNLENSIKIDRKTKGYKYQYRADQDQLILNEVDKQIAKLEKEKADFLKLKEHSNQEGIVSSISKEITNTTTKISKLKQELSDLRSGKTSVKTGKTVQSVIETKVKELKTAEDTLATLTGITKKEGISSNTLASEQADRLKAIEDYRKSISEAEVQAEFDIRQVKIDAMDEGSAKELAQINLNYDKLRDVNRRRANDMIKEQQELERKQWEYDNPKWKEKGMTFKPITTSAQQLSQLQQKQLVSFDSFADISRQKATKEYLDKEKRAMDEYLKEYGSFMEKKQAITDLFNGQISKATTPGEKLSLKKQLDEELKSLDLSEFKKGINFAEVFGNLDNLTTDSITRLRDKLKDYINKAASGLKPEDLKDLSDALANIEIKAAEKNPFGEIGKSLDDYKQATEGVEQAQDKLNYVMSGGEIVIGLYEDSTGKLCKKLLTQEQAENALVKAQNKRAESIARLNTALAAGIGKAQEYLGVATAMVGTLEDFGVEVPEQLTGFIDGMGKTLDSLASIDLTKPVSAITGIIGAIGGIGKAIGSLFNNDSKKEKNIERLQEQVDVLDKSYEKLSQSIENAYSTDASNLIDQQNKMLEQQKVLIEQQIAEEESKKHTDDDRIKEWREQLDEINNTIEDNKVKAQDAIFGSDVKSAIDDFANAYVDAWGAGEDRAKSMKDTVKKMIKGVIVEMMKADLAPTVQALRDKIESALSDGIISDYEQSELDRLIEQATSNMDSKYSWADKYLNGDDPDSTSTREATAKGIASISQDSANAIDGKMSSQLIFLDKTLVEVTGIREQMSFIRELQIRGWEDVRAIRELSSKVSDNTNRIADLSEKIVDVSDKIEVNTSKAARTVQDIKDSGLILKKQ